MHLEMHIRLSGPVSNGVQAVPTVLRGTFQSSGQNCAGVERVLVHRDVHDQVVEQVMQVGHCCSSRSLLR